MSKFWIFFKISDFFSKFFPDIDQISSDEPIEKTKQLRKEEDDDKLNQPPPSPTTKQEYICTENLTIFAQISGKTT